MSKFIRNLFTWRQPEYLDKENTILKDINTAKTDLTVLSSTKKKREVQPESHIDVPQTQISLPAQDVAYYKDNSVSHDSDGYIHPQEETFAIDSDDLTSFDGDATRDVIWDTLKPHHTPQQHDKIATEKWPRVIFTPHNVSIMERGLKQTPLESDSQRDTTWNASPTQLLSKTQINLPANRPTKAYTTSSSPTQHTDNNKDTYSVRTKSSRRGSYIPTGSSKIRRLSNSSTSHEMDVPSANPTTFIPYQKSTQVPSITQNPALQTQSPEDLSDIMTIYRKISSDDRWNALKPRGQPTQHYKSSLSHIKPPLKLQDVPRDNRWNAGKPKGEINSLGRVISMQTNAMNYTLPSNAPHTPQTNHKSTQFKDGSWNIPKPKGQKSTPKIRSTLPLNTLIKQSNLPNMQRNSPMEVRGDLMSIPNSVSSNVPRDGMWNIDTPRNEGKKSTKTIQGPSVYVSTKSIPSQGKYPQSADQNESIANTAPPTQGMGHIPTINNDLQSLAVSPTSSEDSFEPQSIAMLSNANFNPLDNDNSITGRSITKLSPRSEARQRKKKQLQLRTAMLSKRNESNYLEEIKKNDHFVKDLDPENFERSGVDTDEEVEISPIPVGEMNSPRIITNIGNESLVIPDITQVPNLQRLPDPTENSFTKRNKHPKVSQTWDSNEEENSIVATQNTNSEFPVESTQIASRQDIGSIEQANVLVEQDEGVVEKKRKLKRLTSKKRRHLLKIHLQNVKLSKTQLRVLPSDSEKEDKTEEDNTLEEPERELREKKSGGSANPIVVGDGDSSKRPASVSESSKEMTSNVQQTRTRQYAFERTPQVPFQSVPVVIQPTSSENELEQAHTRAEGQSNIGNTLDGAANQRKTGGVQARSASNTSPESTPYPIKLEYLQDCPLQRYILPGPISPVHNTPYKLKYLPREKFESPRQLFVGKSSSEIGRLDNEIDNPENEPSESLRATFSQLSHIHQTTVFNRMGLGYILRSEDPDAQHIENVRYGQCEHLTNTNDRNPNTEMLQLAHQHPKNDEEIVGAAGEVENIMVGTSASMVSTIKQEFAYISEENLARNASETSSEHSRDLKIKNSQQNFASTNHQTEVKMEIDFETSLSDDLDDDGERILPAKLIPGWDSLPLSKKILAMASRGY
jgi:hypothetical protein